MSVTKERKKIKRKIIKIDEDLCTGCGKCVTGCAEGALAIIDGKAKVVNESFCDGLGACIGECPEGALEIVEREAYAFDEELVEDHLNNLQSSANKLQKKAKAHSHQCSCPSSKPIEYNTEWIDSKTSELIPSALRQWPSKLELVNPEASYFNNKELLIVSDCSPVAFGDFHRKILRGKPLVTICPMLNLREDELDKLESILHLNPIEEVHLILMDVPCCQKVKLFLDPIIGSLKKKIIVKQTVIGRDGSILKKEELI